MCRRYQGKRDHHATFMIWPTTCHNLPGVLWPPESRFLSVAGVEEKYSMTGRESRFWE